MIRKRLQEPPSRPVSPAEYLATPRGGRGAAADAWSTDSGLRAASVLDSDHDGEADSSQPGAGGGGSLWAAVRLGERPPPDMWSDDDAASPPPSPPSPPHRCPPVGPEAQPSAKRACIVRSLWPTTPSPSPPPQRPSPPRLRNIAELAAFCAAPPESADGTGLERLDVTRLLAASARAAARPAKAVGPVGPDKLGVASSPPRAAPRRATRARLAELG